MKKLNSPPLSDSVLFPLAEKKQVLDDWNAFLRHDFEEGVLTEALYHHLVYRCLYNPRLTREDLWHYYFSADIGRLKRFLSQFGGDHSHAEGDSSQRWLSLTTPAADVNAAMRRQMERIYPALMYELDIISREMYLAGKWDALFKAGNALDASNGRLLHWSESFEDQFPFEEHADLIRVTPQIREWLGSVARRILDELRPARQSSLFDLRPPRPVQAVRQPDLFMNLHLPLSGQTERRQRLSAPVEVANPRRQFEPERKQLELTAGGKR